MKKFIKNSMLFGVILTMLTSPAIATSDNVISKPNVISIDELSGIKVIRDAAGGIVISGLPTPYAASQAEQKRQLEIIDKFSDNNIIQGRSVTFADEDYYDTEDDPIYWYME